MAKQWIFDSKKAVLIVKFKLKEVESCKYDIISLTL
jgi:hypothetical protein